MSMITVMKLSTLLFLVIPLSCSSVRESDLYGTYFAEYEFGSEKIILHSNGDYEQIVEITHTAESFRTHGKWRYLPRFSEIDLENAYTVQDGFGHLDPSYSVPFNGRVLKGVYQYFPWNPIRLGSDELVQLVKLPDDDVEENH